MNEATPKLVADFQALVFSGVKRALEIDGHCKSYEGTVEFHCSLPDYFRATQGESWGLSAAFGVGDFSYVLELHCYVLGPGRHYEWSGADQADLFERATADVKKWIAELEES